MKHAGPAALDALEPLLAALRTRAELNERRRGVFYLKSRAFLHFHEDPAGLFADLLGGAQDLRLRVSEATEQAALLAAVDRALARPAG